MSAATETRGPQRRRPMHGPGAMMSVEKPKDLGGTIRRLLKFMGRYRIALVAVIGLTAYARSGDRDEERALRRRQRLGVAPVQEVEAKDVKEEGKAPAENAPAKAE